MAIKQVVMGTAGHIDHGKTQLIKTLTGIDTDRLKEEKERGITIDLGFAHLRFADDTEVGVIDVPGHAGSDEMQAVWSYVRGKVWGREPARPQATTKEKKRVTAA